MFIWSLDTIETFFDSRLDLFERRLKKHSDRLKFKAEEALRRTRTPIQGEMDFDKEIQKFKIKVITTEFLYPSLHIFCLQVSQRMASLASAWPTAMQLTNDASHAQLRRVHYLPDKGRHHLAYVTIPNS